MRKRNSSDPYTYILGGLIVLVLLIAAIQSAVQTLWTIIAPYLFWVATLLVLVVVVMFVLHWKSRGNGFGYR